MWYVVQVKAGSERKVVTLIERNTKDDVIKECFSLQYEKMVKHKGIWRTWLMPLIPGYVILVTENIDEVSSELRKVPAFTKLLGDQYRFIPLTQDEMSWISAFTEKDRRVVGMSEGIIEGDEIVILKGPLMGHSAWITSINRHKRLAYLKMEMFGRTITTKCGLSIIARRPEKASKTAPPPSYSLQDVPRS